MATIEQLATAVLDGDQLVARALAAELVAAGQLSSLPVPGVGCDRRVGIMAAALAELLADYAEVARPAWTDQWGAMPDLVDLLPATSDRLRSLLAAEAPEPLRRRNIVAPDGFLRAV